jgi:hypothetical protein
MIASPILFSLATYAMRITTVYPLVPAGHNNVKAALVTTA